MDFSVYSQLILFLSAVVFSLIVGIEYDFFRIFRVVFTSGKTVVFFEDLIFFILCAVEFLIFCFFFANGEIRLYVVLVCVAGFSLYYLTVGRCIYGKLKNTILKIKRRRGSKQVPSANKESENEVS